MITKFKLFLEKYESGVVNIKIDGVSMVFTLSVNEGEKGLEINLLLDNKKYAELSVIVPDSLKLDNNEFYMNPIIDINIIKKLEKQNFISKSGKKSIAGDKDVNSYTINF